MNTEEISVNTISAELENIAIKFEERSRSGLLILPAAYRPLATEIAVRLVAASAGCGLIGNRLHNTRTPRHTQLYMLFEHDEIHCPVGDVYLVDMGRYTNTCAIHQAALYACNFGEHCIFISSTPDQELPA